MAQEDRDILDVLKFELSFLEDGGYGRSPRTSICRSLPRPGRQPVQRRLR